MLKLVHILAVSDAEVNKIFLKRQLQRSVILQYYNITAPRVFNTLNPELNPICYY